MELDLFKKPASQQINGNCGNVGNAGAFYKDIWALIMLKLRRPKDFRNVALTCKVAARAANEVKFIKAVHFAEKQYSFMFRSDLVVISWYLPNMTRFGPQILQRENTANKHYWFGNELQRGKDDDKIEFLEKSFQRNKREEYTDHFRF